MKHYSSFTLIKKRLSLILVILLFGVSFLFAEDKTYTNDDLEKYPRSKPSYQYKQERKQITIRYFQQTKAGGIRDNEFRFYKCQYHCKNLSTDPGQYLEKGWKIISSRSIESIERPFEGDGYCQCIGVEYILE